MFKLITPQDVKTLTKGDFGPEHDVLLELIIASVGEIFSHYCHRPDFDFKSRTEYFSPRENTNLLFIASPPIDETTDPPTPVDVFEDTDLPRTYATELVNGTDYLVHEAEGIIQRIGDFAEGPKAVKVVYRGGYLTADAQGTPEDLRLAAIMQAKILYDRREELSLSSRSLEGGSINLLTPMTLPKSVTMVLDRYKLYRCA